MNSKEFKAEKKLKKKKPSLKNGAQQVFVLPPNLLQKLGINLGNVENNPKSSDKCCKMSTCVPNHKYGHSSSNTEHEINSNIINNETSIIKTANLMKESVFLSPTFNNANLDNVTSSHIGGYVEACNAEINYENNKKVSNEKNDSSHIISEHDSINRREPENKYNNSECDVGSSVKNSTLETNGVTTSEKLVFRNETKKGINIISQVTVTTAKLSELKVSQMPTMNTMIPASLNTIIGKKINKNTVTQSHTLLPITKSITQNLDFHYSESDDKIISKEIHVSKTDNIINIDPKIYCTTENICKSDHVQNQMLNNETSEQLSQNNLEGTDLFKYFDNKNCQVMLSNTINEKRMNDPSVESNLYCSLNHNEVGVTDKVIGKQPMLTDIDYTNSVKTPSSNNYSQKQPSTDNYPLGNNHRNVVQLVNGSKLDEVKTHDVTQSVESYLSDVIDTNDNTRNHNNSNVDENKVKVLEDICGHNDQRKNIYSNSLKSDKKKTFSIEEYVPTLINSQMEENNVINDPKICTSDTFENNEYTSVANHEIPFHIVNVNMSPLSKCLKSVQSQSLSGTFDDEKMNKLSLPLNPKRNNLMSKLCIQGVEKPGGIKFEAQKKVFLKTYSNTNKRKLHGKCFSTKETIFSVQFNHSSNIDLNETSTIELLSSQQFCKCCDYGILNLNQFENCYEHIHFSQKKPLDCSSNIIFSIYDNETMHVGDTKENLDHIEDNTDQTDSEYSDHFICWYNAGLVQNHFDMEFENSQVTEYLYSLPNALNMEGVTETDKNFFSNKLGKSSKKNELQTTSGSNGNKLNCQNQSKKRKISNTCVEVQDNKRAKNLINHEVDTENPSQTQQKDQVVTQDFKGWTTNNSIVNVDNRDVINEQQHVKCAVCGMDMLKTEWLTHIASKHDYIAWKEGESPVNLEDEDAIRDHLHHVVQELGQLECSNCGLTRKYAKAFLHHIRSCRSSSDTNEDAQLPYHLSRTIEASAVPVSNCDHCGHKCKNAKDYYIHMRKCVRSGLNTRNSSDIDVSTNVTCGVCKEEMSSHQWIEHIQKKHNYQAWREGDTPLNVQDEELIRKHLYRILQEFGPLVCSKCGKSRKYVKLFLQHIESCTGPKEHDDTLDTSTVEWESVLDTSLNDTGIESSKLVKCGQCHLEMESKDWIDHIQEKHNYLSWQEGKTPLDITDEETVRRYLYVVVQKLGTLACAKCGAARRYVKSYLSHVDNCRRQSELDPKSTNNNSVDADSSQQINTNLTLSVVDSQVQPVIKVKCGVCQKEMIHSMWITHIGINHEYIAWKGTETPIDISNYEEICQHLTNIVREIGALKCADCGRRCKYAKDFLLHIKNCYGKIYVAIDDANDTLNQSVSDTDETLDTTCVDEEGETKIVKCGVCSAEMEARQWTDHVHRQHNYLAWRDGDAALNLENKESIRIHLKSLLRKIGRLTCAKCGLRRRKVLPFYSHMKTCDGVAKSLDKPIRNVDHSEGTVKCAVCQTDMANSLWIEHIAKEHEYMAWKDGDNPLEMDDEASVRDHLYKISQTAGELICSKCGQSRKYVKSYLQHIRGCTGTEEQKDGAFKVAELKKESTKMVTCALCRQEMDEYSWMDHISREHNYVSWKQNEPPLVFKDENALRDHLYNIVQSIGSLTCIKCGLVRKYAKSYLLHIETCQKVTWRSINKIVMKMKKEKGDMVRCAVCSVEVDDTEWVEHIASHHNYLAWRDRDPAINLEDEEEVRRHLRNIIQEEGYLKCPKCNLQRKYAKLYLHHVNNCDGTEDYGEMNDSMNDTELGFGDGEVDDPDDSTVVKCGACAQEVKKTAWISHIQKEHKYLAWVEGKKPIDLNDKDAVYSHLSAINIKCKGLTCGSCGLVRKYVKAFLHHVRDCSERNYVDSNEIVECGVCGEKIVGKLWRDHAMQTHYNIAWVVGDTPIDLRSFFSVDKYLKEYQEYNHRLVCNICGLSRASLAGFYAHILVCGKTDEEIDKWKDVCDICNQKYLCIYKTQHYWAHRVQEMTKERKIQDTLKKEEFLNEEIKCTPGRRRAAEKARSVIGDYAAKFASYKCKSCTFETDSKEDLSSHRCLKRAMYSNEDSDESSSIKLEDFSEEESEDSDIDSGLSNEEEQQTVVYTGSHKKIRNEAPGGKLATKCSKFPFDVRDVKPYLQQSKLDHFKLFYTRETLFPNWRDSTYEIVPDELLPQYMPQLEESCKMSISNGSWTTYKRFESKKENGCKVSFTGGSIQCIAWAPEHADSTPACPSLLAVATHRGSDCPRLQSTDTVSHPALIQLWNFQNFKSIPKLAFGLAHDYGTVWAMDWCPSGTRDLSDNVGSDNVRARLGLLAVACSNGSAYVISVPYPDKNRTSEITFYKIKPCVELRVTRGSIKYQATSINWSLFQGYTTISVGYGDGTVALYDLVTESPLLTAKEGDIDILYPFQDERLHNSCVTGLTSCVLGAWCSSSATGSTAGVAGMTPRAGRGARPLRTHSALAASAPTFMPHWPNVMLSGDDTIVGLSPSELEWGYVGRRVGSVRAIAPCLHRARVAAVVPPLLQAMRPHPAAFKGHKTIHKKNVAMLEMTPLARKRSKHTNDELSMKVEPITYEDAVASYGIEFKFERDFDKAFVQRMQQKHRVPYPERFPLADVPALAYCPAAAHYTKLALATHAGLLLLFDV